MAVTYRVSVPRKDEKSGKTYWTNIGSAWKRDTGAMSVSLNALPIGVDGKCEFMIFPPDDKGGRGRDTDPENEPF